jgi:hypothetical protein
MPQVRTPTGYREYTDRQLECRRPDSNSASVRPAPRGTSRRYLLARGYYAEGNHLFFDHKDGTRTILLMGAQDTKNIDK